MPRILPWLRTEAGTPVEKESTPRKRVKAESSPDRDLTPKCLPVSPSKRDFFRSSQSPPTSPVRSCPPEEFLIEGIEQDDGWIMVEDEFYAIAQTFTQHLHHAEYLRRRKEVKAANLAGIREIDRPTDGRTSLPPEVQRKKEAESLRERQKAGLAQMEDRGAGEQDEQDEDDDQRWAGTHLHNLMTSPRKTRSLAGVQAPKSSTRAAAGFGQAPVSSAEQARVNSIGKVTSHSGGADLQSIDLDEETASGSDDDLDLDSLPVMQPPAKRFRFTQLEGQSDDQTTPRPSHRARLQSTSTPKRTASPIFGRSSPANGFKSRVQSLFDDLDELPESSPVNMSISANTRGPSARESPGKGGENNLDPRKSRHNEVPTFLV